MSDDRHDHEARIRERAYFLWKEAGSPEGTAEAHWEQARLLLAADAEAGEPLEVLAAAVPAGSTPSEETAPKPATKPKRAKSAPKEVEVAPKKAKSKDRAESKKAKA